MRISGSAGLWRCWKRSDFFSDGLLCIIRTCCMLFQIPCLYKHVFTYNHIHLKYYSFIFILVKLHFVIWIWTIRTIRTNPPLFADSQVIIPHCLCNVILPFIHCPITRVVIEYTIICCLRFIVIWIVWEDKIMYCSQCCRNSPLNSQAIFWGQKNNNRWLRAWECTLWIYMLSSWTTP